ncbi:tail fiber assembly protein [Photobacterium sp. TLY01]|uniref:tail fiber assembly protein n=1 Tax=Photobacterium sp. TLY01 TaxID=2907534 RepID=UPI001F3DE5F9|nr:tail fiber assembly protein [Photobacterium sp. TLY01]UIP28898.1 phage tail assembly chaperone [Photobacterium sp. TLY01]
MKYVDFNGKRIYSPSPESLKEMGFPDDDVTQIMSAYQWIDIREKRDALITETDWTQTGDAPISAEKKAEFTAYRQLLRDIPQTYSNPDDVVWPTKPTI